MAIDLAFYGAFIPPTASYARKHHRILGARLRPFCLWHLLLLQAVDSPSLCKGDVQLYDVKMAVGICRLRFGDSDIRRPALPLLVAQKRLEKEVSLFLAYAGYFLQMPEYAVDNAPPVPQHRPPQAPKSPRGAPPEPLRLACEVMAYLHCDEVRAWEMPLGMARWYSVMAQRAAGVPIDFLTDEQREFQQKMKEAGIQPVPPQPKEEA